MPRINELTLAKELIKFPSVTPKDAGAIGFLAKQLKSIGFSCKILEFKDKNKKSKPIKNIYARLGKKALIYVTLDILMLCHQVILKTGQQILLNQLLKKII